MTPMHIESRLSHSLRVAVVLAVLCAAGCRRGDIAPADALLAVQSHLRGIAEQDRALYECATYSQDPVYLEMTFDYYVLVRELDAILTERFGDEAMRAFRRGVLRREGPLLRPVPAKWLAVKPDMCRIEQVGDYLAFQVPAWTATYIMRHTRDGLKVDIDAGVNVVVFRENFLGPSVDMMRSAIAMMNAQPDLALDALVQEVLKDMPKSWTVSKPPEARR